MAHLSLGEYRVGIDFNPSKDEKVDKIKRAAADLIDLIDQSIIETETVNVPEKPGPWDDNETMPAVPHVRTNAELARLKTEAMTFVEDAAMWAVKGITKRPR